MVDLMSRRAKLLKRLYQKPAPRDFTWGELCTLLAGYGFRLLHTSGGSGRKFVNDELKKMIILHEPHPGSTLLPCYIPKVVRTLKSVGIKP